MSNAVFVDTSAWIAVMFSRDALQPVTLRWFAEIERRKCDMVTTSAVLTEVMDGFAAHQLRFLCAPFRARLESLARLEIVHIDEALFQRGWDFYEARTDKDWSLTDCLSFVVMRQRGIDGALAHDHHFEQAGFRALLREAV